MRTKEGMKGGRLVMSSAWCCDAKRILAGPQRGLAGTNVRINLFASEIKRLVDDKSKEVYDSVASVTLEKVTYMNVIAPPAELEAYQFPLSSSVAEIRLDSFFLMCRLSLMFSNFIFFVFVVTLKQNGRYPVSLGSKVRYPLQSNARSKASAIDDSSKSSSVSQSNEDVTIGAMMLAMQS
ncbi:uncharacterized protein A4U43_C05F26940 [Asparagus officinalis]|uniref:Uncharacterized protein n=1 Tax=Asparagus officinalis TaxID=4686 RepID=A0A5P1EUX8_ASPOF|nr:uncharacterized protein A4U43_C05F26940 [Asparagus officinalis]